MNGDAETGPCSKNNVVVAPTGWTVTPPLTQLAYANTIGTPSSSTPGPRYKLNSMLSI